MTNFYGVTVNNGTNSGLIFISLIGKGLSIEVDSPMDPIQIITLPTKVFVSPPVNITALELLNAINSDVSASAVMQVRLADGSDGSGIFNDISDILLNDIVIKDSLSGYVIDAALSVYDYSTKYKMGGTISNVKYPTKYKSGSFSAIQSLIFPEDVSIDSRYGLGG
jgi:hypothetical protein